MPKSASLVYRRAGAPAPPQRTPLAQRWYGQALLLVIGTILLTFAFPPFKQFYLAWIGLVPWMVVLKNCRSPLRAFGWSWLAGITFFSANLGWIYWVTGIGLVALMIILGLYWAVAGLFMRAVGLKGAGFGAWGVAPISKRTDDAPVEPRKGSGTESAAGSPAPSTPIIYVSTPPHPLLTVVGIATVWTGWEWLRGHWPFEGLAWLYIGHTQTPALYLCQIADFAGSLGVSFWVAMVNAWIALFVLNRMSLRRLVPSFVFVIVVTAGMLGYGAWRFSQQPGATVPGPTVMVVQPNYPQSNSGDKGAPPWERIQFHLQQTRAAMQQRSGVDLVVWSETMMPPFNADFLSPISPPDDFAKWVDEPEDTADLWRRAWDRRHAFVYLLAEARVRKLAQTLNVSLLTGGEYLADFRPRAGGEYPEDKRNTAYYFPRPGTPGAGLSYDKVHLVPFGEYIPFKESVPWLYQLLISLGPEDMKDYQLSRGNASKLTVFPLTDSSGRSLRFVTPICFEDIDGQLVSKMFHARPQTATTDPTPPACPGKAADFIVNVTNDGWFRYNQMPQHFQIAQFRSIENRVPTARSVNTGISGYIDSMGRAYDQLPANTEGFGVARLNLDTRITFFTQYGEILAQAVAGLTAVIGVAGLVQAVIHRKTRGNHVR